MKRKLYILLQALIFVFLLLTVARTIVLLPALLLSIIYFVQVVLDSYQIKNFPLPKWIDLHGSANTQRDYFFLRTSLGIISFVISTIFAVMISIFVGMMILWYVGEVYPQFLRIVSILSLMIMTILVFGCNWLILKKMTAWVNKGNIYSRLKRAPGDFLRDIRDAAHPF